MKSLLEEPPPLVVEASLISERADPRELVDVSDAKPSSEECELREEEDELEDDDEGAGGQGRSGLNSCDVMTKPFAVNFDPMLGVSAGKRGVLSSGNSRVEIGSTSIIGADCRT